MVYAHNAMATCANGSEPAPGVGPSAYVENQDVASYLTQQGLYTFQGFYGLVSPEVYLASEFCANEPPLPVALDPVLIALGMTNPLTYYINNKTIIEGARWYAWARQSVCKETAPSGVCGYWPGHYTIGTELVSNWTTQAITYPDGLSYHVENVFENRPMLGKLKVRAEYGPDGVNWTQTGMAVQLDPGALREGSILMPIGTTAYARLRFYCSNQYGNVGGDNFRVTGQHCGQVTPAAPPPIPAPLPESDYQAPTSPTCATLDDVCERLATLQQQLMDVYSVTAWQQRQTAPASYAAGTSHNVAGSGSFTVSNILGLRVHITASPDYLGARPGTPEATFQFGWINTGSVDGYELGKRLLYQDQLIFGVNPACTKVGYSLEQGVSATITELIGSA